MRYQRLFLCGSPAMPAKGFGPAGAEQFSLDLTGPKQNVVLKIADITERMVADLPSIYEDLIEIATYVYCADQSTPRGGSGVRDLGEHWRRDFYFVIAVRNPKFWNRKDVQEALRELLGFLSDDFYEFRFTRLKHRPKFSDYLEFSGENVEEIVDEVVLFSGGLDSLAGALDEIFRQGNRVALVSHRSVSKIYSKQKALVEEIEKRCETKMTHHVPIWIQKLGWKEADTSQRSRSFLYACIAATVAAMFKKKRIRFYENGVTSINLPIAEQVVGARATRTTHPKAIRGMARLFTLVAGGEFRVETPFLWKTKTEIVEMVRDLGHGDLIKYSVSCSHVFQMTKLHTHCGSCSQCIDRRVAALAAGCAALDPVDMYAKDVFVGGRSDEGQDMVLTESYVRMMKECGDLTAMQFFGRYGEISRAVPYIEGRSDDVGEGLYEMYRRNGQQVKQAQAAALKLYAEDIAEKGLASGCLMGQILGTERQVEGDREITLKEAAGILGLVVGTVSRMADDGAIKDNGISGAGRKVWLTSVLLQKQRRDDKELAADVEELRKDRNRIPDEH